MFLIRLKLSELRVLCRLHASKVALHPGFLGSAALNISFRKNDRPRTRTNQTNSVTEDDLIVLLVRIHNMKVCES